MGKVVSSSAKFVSLLGAFLATALVMGLLAAGLAMPVVGLAGATTRGSVTMFEDLPGDLANNPMAEQSKILTADGKEIALLADQNRTVVPLDEISKHMQNAQVAIEDERFYEHGGVDPRGLARAFISNTASDSTQGASTLTQQYVKLRLLDEARISEDPEAYRRLSARSGTEGYVRKMREAKYAITLEKNMSKDDILSGYLNMAYYGNQAYGVEAAAMRYFGVSAKDLTLTQAATLAGVVQLPSATNPIANPERAKTRRNTVLDKMYQLNMIDENQWRKAKSSPPVKISGTTTPRGCAASDYAYFCNYVVDWLMLQPALGKTPKERMNALNTGGLTIKTTLQPKMVESLNKGIQKRVPQGNPEKIGAAAAIVQPGSGRVLALGQNTEYGLEQDKAGTSAVNWSTDKAFGSSNGFQIGSTAKIYTLVAALEAGIAADGDVTFPKLSILDPGSNEEGSDRLRHVFYPADFKDECRPGSKWPVANSSNIQNGSTISLKTATARSINTVYVELLREVGGCKVREVMERMGLHQADGEPISKLAPALALGASNSSAVTLASSYATLAADGKYCSPYPVEEVTRPGGEKLKLKTKQCKEAVDPDIAAAATWVLEDVMKPGVGSGGQAELADGRVSAGKTGTTDSAIETWFAGYTPQYSTAVWVGTPDNDRPMKDITLAGQSYEGYIHGSDVAAPVWKDIMDGIHKGKKKLPFTAPSSATMSSGRVAVPPVIGLSQADAEKKLRDAGFSVEVGPETNSGQPQGTVAEVNPAVGSAQSSGSKVTINISKGN